MHLLQLELSPYTSIAVLKPELKLLPCDGSEIVWKCWILHVYGAWTGYEWYGDHGMIVGLLAKSGMRWVKFLSFKIFYSADHSHAVTEIEVWTVSVCLQYLHPVYLIIVFIFLFSVGMRADILNDMTVALSNDTLAVRDKANEKGESTTPNFP